jgi:hypothetical protein
MNTRSIPYHVSYKHYYYSIRNGMVALASTSTLFLGALFFIWAQPLPTSVSVSSAAGQVFAGYFFKFGELLSLYLSFRSSWPSGRPGSLALLALWPSGPLALWSSWLSGPLVLLTFQLSWLSGPLAAFLILWLTGPLGPLALLPSVRALLWACVPCFGPLCLSCFGPLCLALGLCALLWAFVPCFGPLCLALGLCALLWAFVPCFGLLCLASGLCALLPAFVPCFRPLCFASGL